MVARCAALGLLAADESAQTPGLTADALDARDRTEQALAGGQRAR